MRSVSRACARNGCTSSGTASDPRRPRPTATERTGRSHADRLAFPRKGRLIGLCREPETGEGVGRPPRCARRATAAAGCQGGGAFGDGPGRPDLERETATLGLEAVVHWAGSRPDARRLQPAYDIVVGPSRAEGLPNAILEAAAAGRPIVATRAGGTGEVLTDGHRPPGSGRRPDRPPVCARSTPRRSRARDATGCRSGGRCHETLQCPTPRGRDPRTLRVAALHRTG